MNARHSKFYRLGMAPYVPVLSGLIFDNRTDAVRRASQENKFGEFRGRGVKVYECDESGNFVIKNQDRHTPNASTDRARLKVTDAQMSIVQIHCDDPAHDDEREDWWPTQVSATVIEFPADRVDDVVNLLIEISNSESDGPGGDRGAWRAADALLSKVQKLRSPEQTPNAARRPGARSGRLEGAEQYTTLEEISPGISATRLSVAPSKTLGGKLIETWKVFPTGDPGRPVAQIQLFQDKDRQWASWSVMPRDRVYGVPLAVARNAPKQTPNARRVKKDPTAWRSTPEGETKYREARAKAQDLANADGFDRGIEANDLFREFNVFMLPQAQYRSGHELRAEVVSCENLSRCQRGHGPGAGHTRNGSNYYVWVVSADGTPLATEGPYGPHPLDAAKQLARIGATEGEHDRVVSLGRVPSVPSFEIVRRYRRGTGERII